MAVTLPASYKVTITCGSYTVKFEASTPITESRTANYDGMSIVHLPTDILTYKNTSSRHFNITGKLVSRNSGEAAANSRYVDLIRSWVLPDFGSSGATPPIVKLSAFYNTNIFNLTCVIKNYSIVWPDDVDWIFDEADPANGKSAMPVITTISMELEESYSAAEITKKAWKIKPYNKKGLTAPGGSFKYGGAATDKTSEGGGQDAAQQNSNTPSMSTLAGIPGFSGVADDCSITASTTTSPGQGNLSNVYGVTNSGSIKENTPQTPNVMLNGYDTNTVSQMTTYLSSPPPPITTATPDTYSRNSLPNKSPTKP